MFDKYFYSTQRMLEMFNTKLLSDLTSAAAAPCQAVTTWRMFALLSVYPINMIKYADNPGESRERITPGMTWSTVFSPHLHEATNIGG